jgi:hypothetical protein
LEKIIKLKIKHPYNEYLKSSSDLVTSHEETRAGFVALALEKSKNATPFVAEARALQEAAGSARKPTDLLKIKDIESGMLTASGLSDKAKNHLSLKDKRKAIENLIENFLKPAGAKFVEELVFRFLLTRGDTLGGSMRNIGGAIAQRELVRALIATLRIAGINYKWQHKKSRVWVTGSDEDSDIEYSLRGLHWQRSKINRTLIFNLTVPLVGNNIDLCLFSLDPEKLVESKFRDNDSYLSLGELKGGIDPAGADEHWKTARTAIERIRNAFTKVNCTPDTFFIGAAIEKKMAEEIWVLLTNNILQNAANLNNDKQMASLTRWLCNL